METRASKMRKLALKQCPGDNEMSSCSNSSNPNISNDMTHDNVEAATYTNDNCLSPKFTEFDKNECVKGQLWTKGSDSEASSSSGPDQDVISDCDEAINVRNSPEGQLQKKSRWRKSDPSKWARNREKKKRSECMPYTTSKGLRAAKTPQKINCQSCRFNCQATFNEDDRANICKKFWSLNYKRQKDFILRLVERKSPARPGANVSPSKKRKCSRYYHFMKDEKKCRVCQNFFQTTLNISNGPVNKAFEGCDQGIFSGQDKRGKKRPHNKSKEEDVNFVKQHIEMFPVMESHYCRKKSQRLYLDAKLSIRKMYFLYTEFCRENNRMALSHSMYRKIFCTSYNLSFFVPKKDQCVTCNKYTEGQKNDSLTEDLERTYKAHIERKNEANSNKSEDKERSESDSTFMSATMDLQSVLQVPSGEESLLYYTRKLCIYNFTIYQSKFPNEAYCLLWSEVNGKRGSNEIGTCLMTWLSQLPEEIKEISLFSDTCGGQNRNQHISALLLHLVQTTRLEVIEQKFLESGHSFMEVDSMHSAIEHEKKFVPVHSLLDWMNIMRRARSKRNRASANPYHVIQLKYSDILDLKDLSKNIIKNRLKDENGNQIKWLQIKCLRYEKASPGVIKFRYSYSGPYNILKVFGRGRHSVTKTVKKAYDSQLPISNLKKQDLLKLCRKEIIPQELHAWYESLPTDKNVRDQTNEPAVGEEEREEVGADETNTQ